MVRKGRPSVIGRRLRNLPATLASDKLGGDGANHAKAPPASWWASAESPRRCRGSICCEWSSPDPPRGGMVRKGRPSVIGRRLRNLPATLASDKLGGDGANHAKAPPASWWASAESPRRCRGSICCEWSSPDPPRGGMVRKGRPSVIGRRLRNLPATLASDKLGGDGANHAKAPPASWWTSAESPRRCRGRRHSDP